MLTKLLPNDIEKYWGVIRQVAYENIADIKTEEQLISLLEKLMLGHVICWLYSKKVEDGYVTTGLILTTFIADDIAGVRSLLIYLAYAFEELDDLAYAESFIALCKYAKSQNCVNMITYTDVPKLIEQAKSINASVNQRLIVFDLL